MDCSPPGSYVHGISQARILEWVAMSSSRGSSPPRDRTQISSIAAKFFITKPPGKPNHMISLVFNLVEVERERVAVGFVLAYPGKRNWGLFLKETMTIL